MLSRKYDSGRRKRWGGERVRWVEPEFEGRISTAAFQQKFVNLGGGRYDGRSLKGSRTWRDDQGKGRLWVRQAARPPKNLVTGG